MAADRTPALSAAPPPAPTAGAAPPAGQAMDRSWFSGTNVSKLLFFDLGRSRVYNFIVEGISRKVLSLVQKENDVCRYKVDGPFRWFAQGPHTRRVCDDRAVSDRLCGAHRAHAAAAPTRRSRAHARENTDGNSWQSRPRRACASHEAVLLPRGCRASAARCSARSRRPAAIVSAANVRAFVPGARV